jgi:NAD(P)-dependent dehydrogenase (short-subunit alcohol dehydrogenase family)
MLEMARQKVLVVGATGIIGSAVSSMLERDHEVVRIARKGGDVRMDALSTDSIQQMYAQVGAFDALVSTMGRGVVGAFETLSEQHFLQGFKLKTLAQINLVRLGLGTVRARGSFTLSSGYLSKHPRATYAAVAVANGGIDAFCRAAALEMANGVRINCVSPVFVVESMRAHGITDLVGYDTQSAAETAHAYYRAVTGDFTGKDVDPRVAV